MVHQLHADDPITPQQARQRFAMMADDLRTQRRGLVGPVESPVLLQFPRQKTKDARDEPGDGKGLRNRVPFVLGPAELQQ